MVDAPGAGRIESLAPITAPDARILILGSMPGAASLQAQQYYAHPRNAFWPIMSALFGVDAEAAYAERTRVLREQGVALWDVLHSCVRPGSLDTSISDEAPNDFAAFFAVHPGLRVIGLNGGKALSSFEKHIAFVPPNVRAVALPSTSPAHARLKLADKVEA